LITRDTVARDTPVRAARSSSVPAKLPSLAPIHLMEALSR
jgi:hypothetical protein